MKYFILLLALSFPLKASSQLSMPIGGEQNKDWWVWTYVDNDSTVGSVSNFKCSNYAYDNWFGLVLQLKNFQLMDSGIPVLAAGNGVVTDILDGSPDRTKQSDTGGHGNDIWIKHNPSLYSFYGFLRNHSIRVKIGQAVHKGDTIAMVGSSGVAYTPKLYFRLEDGNGIVIDPLGYRCGTPPVQALLASGPIYDTAFGLLDAGVTNTSGVTLDTIIERPPTVKEISVTDDAYVCVWTQVKNSYTGDSNEHIWIKPDGSIFHRAQWTETNDSHIGYPRSWQPTYNLDTGMWTVKCLFNGDTITTQTFHVVEQHSGVAQTNPASRTITFPQPSKDHVTIAGIVTKEAHLFDIDGIEHAIQFENISEGVNIYWQHIPKGVYYLSLKDQEGLLHNAKISVSP